MNGRPSRCAKILLEKLGLCPRNSRQAQAPVRNGSIRGTIRNCLFFRTRPLGAIRVLREIGFVSPEYTEYTVSPEYTCRCPALSWRALFPPQSRSCIRDASDAFSGRRRNRLVQMSSRISQLRRLLEEREAGLAWSSSCREGTRRIGACQAWQKCELLLGLVDGDSHPLLRPYSRDIYEQGCQVGLEKRGTGTIRDM